MDIGGPSNPARGRPRVQPMIGTLCAFRTHHRPEMANIVRRDSRTDLGSKGLIGKVRLTSAMLEEDTMEEICTVFSGPMGNYPQFPFSFLQRCVPGSNALTVSSSFEWTARLGKGAFI